jgi:hypothetical protein
MWADTALINEISAFVYNTHFVRRPDRQKIIKWYLTTMDTGGLSIRLAGTGFSRLTPR